jgi:hypothetical protein
MNLDSCFICKRPVLEFEGQFEKLDTYLLNESDDAYQQGAFGWCHARCLSTSNWGAFWAERRIQHMTEVMGFVKSSEIGALTAIRNPRTGEMIVLRRTDGITFRVRPSAFARKKDCLGGILLPVSENMHLEFDDPKLACEIRDSLVKSRCFPLSKLVEALNVTDCLLYPEAVLDGMMQFDKTLKQHWMGTCWVSAVVAYNQFMPQAVVDLVTSDSNL